MTINGYQFDINKAVNALHKETIRKGRPLLSKTRMAGDYLMVQCPYHKNGKERTPSAQFRISDGLFYCFACKEVHSFVDVVEHCIQENGWNWLRKNFLHENNIRELDISTKEEKPIREYVQYEDIRQFRRKVPYLINRGISEEVIKKFEIGYDITNQNVVFPNKDENGNILFLATRNINEKRFSYPLNVDKPIYGLYEVKKYYPDAKEVIVVESMINCLTCWTYGKPAVALNGTGSSSQIKKLAKLPYRSYILGLDPDEAGEKGCLKIKKGITNKLLERYLIPEGKDINDLTKEEFEALNKIYI